MLNTHGARLAFTRFANGVTRFGLPSEAFDQIAVKLPPLPEQRAIASVLITADEEINSLEAKRTALERQKKGLLQKLLTGEVRVKTR